MRSMKSMWGTRVCEGAVWEAGESGWAVGDGGQREGEGACVCNFGG